MSSSNISSGQIGLENFVKAAEAYDTAYKSISKNPSMQRFIDVKKETKAISSEIFNLKAKLETIQDTFTSNLMANAKILSVSDSEPNLVWEDLISAKKELKDKCAELTLLYAKIQKTNFGAEDDPFTYDDYLNTKKTYKHAVRDQLQKNRSGEELKSVLENCNADGKLFSKLEKVTLAFLTENFKTELENVKISIENTYKRIEVLKKRIEIVRKGTNAVYFVITGVFLSITAQRQLSIPLAIAYGAMSAAVGFLARMP